MTLPDDVLQRWEEAASWTWDETSSECRRCRARFQTGDVCVVFGLLDAVIARKDYYCAQCGYQEILSFRRPSGTAVFVEDAHRGLRLDALPRDVRDRLTEGFEIVDRIHGAFAEIAARAGQLNQEEGES